MKNSPHNTGDIKYTGSISGSERDPGGGHGKPTTLFLPGESHGQRSLAGYSPQCRKELGTSDLACKQSFSVTFSQAASWQIPPATRGQLARVFVQLPVTLISNSASSLLIVSFSAP